MCCWAIKEAGIERVVLGARHAAMRRTDYGDYSVEKLLAMTRTGLVRQKWPIGANNGVDNRCPG
jgi:tRNA(Arg) A34 adenosine deaminase TadA